MPLTEELHAELLRLRAIHAEVYGGLQDLVWVARGAVAFQEVRTTIGRLPGFGWPWSSVAVSVGRAKPR